MHVRNFILCGSLFYGLLLAGSPSFAKTCAEKKVRYGEGRDSFEVSEYRPEASTKSLMIIPPTGGTNLIDRSYSEKFCDKGYDVYLVNDWPRPGEGSTDLEVHEKFYSNAQRAIRLVAAGIKTPFLGLLGTSVGALHASIAAATQEKFDAVFLIVGGLSIAEVIVTSDQQAMQELRDVRRKRFHFQSAQENIKAIEKVFTLEPMKQPPLPRQKLIGAVISAGDTTVPYKTQVQLQEFFHPSKIISMNNDHFWAIVKTWLFHTGELIEFFDTSAATKK